jgi:hypothetical protein
MMYKSMITLAMALSLPLAQAQQVREIPELQVQVVSDTSDTLAATGKAQPLATTFGTYVTVAGYTAGTADLVQNAETVATFGELSVFADPTQAKPAVVTQHTVVRNLISGELAIVTGRISVLTQDAAALNAAVRQLGLKQLKSLRKGQLQMLQASSHADLLALTQQLQKVSGVKTVKLDVLDKRHTPQ